MTIRPYTPADTEALLIVFGKNVPEAFAEHELADYAEFLRTRTEPYFVAELDGRVVGACGYHIRPDGQSASIIWILADPDTRGRGVGTALIGHMLGQIRQRADVRAIETRTSQVAYRFFEKFGFRLVSTQTDYWAPGLDLYTMTTAPAT